MNLTDRLSRFIKSKKISMMEFEKNISVSNGLISKAVRGNKSIGSDKIEKIFSIYPEFNPTWLLTGKGEMLLKGGENPVLGLEKTECERCKDLEKDIKHLEQIIEAKDETIRAYRDNRDNRDSKEENRHSA